MAQAAALCIVWRRLPDAPTIAPFTAKNLNPALPAGFRHASNPLMRRPAAAAWPWLALPTTTTRLIWCMHPLTAGLRRCGTGLQYNVKFGPALYAPGTKYSFTARANNSAGLSPVSAVRNYTTPRQAPTRGTLTSPAGGLVQLLAPPALKRPTHACPCRRCSRPSAPTVFFVSVHPISGDVLVTVTMGSSGGLPISMHRILAQPTAAGSTAVSRNVTGAGLAVSSAQVGLWWQTSPDAEPAVPPGAGVVMAAARCRLLSHALPTACHTPGPFPAATFVPCSSCSYSSLASALGSR